MLTNCGRSKPVPSSRVARFASAMPSPTQFQETGFGTIPTMSAPDWMADGLAKAATLAPMRSTLDAVEKAARWAASTAPEPYVVPRSPIWTAGPDAGHVPSRLDVSPAPAVPAVAETRLPSRRYRISTERLTRWALWAAIVGLPLSVAAGPFGKPLGKLAHHLVGLLLR